MKSLLDRFPTKARTSIPANTVLLETGKRSGKLYVLIEGQIEISRDNIVVASVREPGAVFGEMSILLDVPHTADVRAVSDVTVYEFLDAQNFMRSDPEITFLVAQLLAQRLNTVTTYLVDLKKQYAASGNHLGMVSDVLASLVFQPQTEFTPGSDRTPDYEM